MGERNPSFQVGRLGYLAASFGIMGVLAGHGAAQTPGRKGAAATPRTPAAVRGGTVNGPVVARVNGQEITYRELAEECIARKGGEVLDTMISRLIVMQACDQKGIRVTAAEIDEEMGKTAKRLNMSREEFLKLIKEQRDIPPKRYAEEIVMPGLALKKLAHPHVKVTEGDITRGFEALYGEKVKCRWIMLPDLRRATEIWNELHEAGLKSKDGKIPLAEFEHKVLKWSTDVATRSIGGQINPISRHTSPAFKAIEDAAFAMQADGEISKVVQMGESFIILYREGKIAPQKVTLQDVRTQIESQIYEAKMREQIGLIFQDLQANARVENLLTGDVSLPKGQAADTDSEKAPAKRPSVRVGAKPEKATKSVFRKK